MDIYILSYLLIIIGIIISVLADLFVRNTYKKYSNIKNNRHLTGFDTARKILDNNQKDIFLMSRNTKNILRNSDFEYIKNTRRKNYNYLYENLKIDGIINQLGNLQETETPFYFPLYVNKQVRKEFQQYMAKENIFCPIIWKKDKRLNIENYYCNNIYDKIICIPCDQRYNEEDMNRIVKVIKKFYCKG